MGAIGRGGAARGGLAAKLLRGGGRGREREMWACPLGPAVTLRAGWVPVSWMAHLNLARQVPTVSHSLETRYPRRLPNCV